MFKEFLFVLISVSLVSSRSLTKSEWLDINRLLEIAAIRKAGQLNYGADDNLLRSNNELQYDDDEYDRYENEPKAFNVVDHLVDPSSAFEPLSRQVRYSEDKDRYEAAIKAMDKTNKDYLQALQGGNNKPFKDLFSSERWRCLLGLSYVFGLMLFSGFLDRVGSEQCSLSTSTLVRVVNRSKIPQKITKLKHNHHPTNLDQSLPEDGSLTQISKTWHRSTSTKTETLLKKPAKISRIKPQEPGI